MLAHLVLYLPEHLPDELRELSLALLTPTALRALVRVDAPYQVCVEGALRGAMLGGVVHAGLEVRERARGALPQACRAPLGGGLVGTQLRRRLVAGHALVAQLELARRLGLDVLLREAL